MCVSSRLRFMTNRNDMLSLTIQEASLNQLPAIPNTLIGSTQLDRRCARNFYLYINTHQFLTVLDDTIYAYLL
jgi:hypothetical protein